MATTPITILLADDDEDDRLLARDALGAARPMDTLFMVEDGEELLEFLRHEGRYAGTTNPVPAVILLDLNMPGKDGRDVLRELKADALLRHIPVVVLSTSSDGADIFETYDSGGNSYITKPHTFSGLVEVMETLGKYWFQIVDLPDDADPAVTVQ